MDAALSVLDQKSIFDATVEDFVDTAGVARGTFYIYFSDKYGVLTALSERINDEVFQHAYGIIDYRLPTFERLRAALAGIVAIWEQHSTLLRSIMQIGSIRPEFFKIQQQLRAPFIERGKRELEHSIDHGHARPIDPEVATRVLSAMIDWFCMLRFGLNDRPAPDWADDYLIDQLALLWYRALFAGDPPVPASQDSEAAQTGV
jgi:AcrR family transcriptional regulator